MVILVKRVISLSRSRVWSSKMLNNARRPWGCFQQVFISIFSSSNMLEDVSSSKLCFEEEIVKFVFVINMYLSAMKYFTCRLWSSFSKVQCHHPCKNQPISSFKFRKSVRKQKDRVVLNEKVPKLKTLQNGLLRSKN